MRYKIHIFIFFVLAPFLGLGIAYAQIQPFALDITGPLSMQEEIFQGEADKIAGQMLDLKESIREVREATDTSTRLISMIRENAVSELRAYEQQHARLQDLVAASSEQSRASGDMVDFVLANMLGDPVGQTFGENATIKVYSLEEAGYRGYMAKVRLHNANALKMVL